MRKLSNKYNGDFSILMSKTKMSKSELENFFRILEIRDFVDRPEVKELLSAEEYRTAKSDRFPITILERFFNYSQVKTKWGIEYDGIEVKIISNKQSFYAAYTELIKRIVNDNDYKINTRMKKENLEEILPTLPEVTFEPTDETLENTKEKIIQNQEDSKNNNENYNNNSSAKNQSKTMQSMKGNLNRNKMVLPIYTLHTDSYRLDRLFNKEFQRISVTSYPNSVASALRVFLDLAVLNYIDSNDIREDISRQYKEDFREITLKKRLTYLKDNILNGKPKTIVTQLLEEKNHYSLSVLNGYVHSNETHHLDKRILNGFWDFLFPIFEEFLDIREIHV